MCFSCFIVSVFLYSLASHYFCLNSDMSLYLTSPCRSRGLRTMDRLKESDMNFLSFWMLLLSSSIKGVN